MIESAPCSIALTGTRKDDLEVRRRASCCGREMTASVVPVGSESDGGVGELPHQGHRREPWVDAIGESCHVRDLLVFELIVNDASGQPDSARS